LLLLLLLLMLLRDASLLQLRIVAKLPEQNTEDCVVDLREKGLM
jgi:hypothetical protein